MPTQDSGLWQTVAPSAKTNLIKVAHRGKDVLALRKVSMLSNWV